MVGAGSDIFIKHKGILIVELIMKDIAVKSVLIESNLPVADYSVNPYTGCQHACKYCYASFMKRFTNHPELFRRQRKRENKCDVQRKSQALRKWEKAMEQGRYQRFTVDGKEIDVFLSAAPNRPVVYLNTFSSEGGRVRAALQEAECPDFSLVAVSGLEWDHDMAPWDIPPISKNDTPCTGGADGYLRFLTGEIVPRAEEMLPGAPCWRGLAGYSLAGLFAVYAMYQTDLFSRIGSMSGSLWFPNFKEYALTHALKRKPEHLYFSLGDKECRTRNAYLKNVQSNTEELAAFYRGRQIDTVFQLNPGNHFVEAVKRSALGIQWLLTR